ADRFLACIAYLDGTEPSLVMCRGYYTSRDGTKGRTVLAAWDWRNHELIHRWTFEANPKSNREYLGQGNHNLSVGDIDDDGKDEIVYGACCIDDDGTGLYTTGLGHGDAMHLSDMDPNHPGLEVFAIHEDPGSYGPNGGEFRAAGTGQLIYGIDGHGTDVGRGCAFDIDPRYLGYEAWISSDDYIYDVHGNAIYGKNNAFLNFGIWWDADPLREMLDGTTIAKWRWDYTPPGRQNLVYAPAGTASNNGTKKTPCLTADIFGDWREEVIWRTNDNQELRIYTTTIPTTYRIYTLMHDPQYRLSIAWQNVAYNQPPHTGFYLGDGMSTPPIPNIQYPGATPVAQEQAQPQMPEEFVLEQNFPNPFNSSTTIRYSIPEETNVQLKIYNMLGKEIKTLTNSRKQRGNYQIQWDGKDSQEVQVPTGIYFYELRTNKFSVTRKLIILR
ncbi:MAG: T9SS type A sorting domain-containing protein, partial [candidate division KSB1 bacterium]|nr:T9SS type A sorting domain-containing protein [candidate division KSB1 bacterium]